MSKLPRRRFSFFPLLLAFLLCAPAQARTNPKKSGGDVYSDKSVRAVMQKVFEWQVAHPVEIDALNNNLWARAAFYAGVMSAGRATGDRRYSEQATRWAESRGWRLGERPRHADDHAPGQAFLELYMLKRDPRMIEHTRSVIDTMVATPRLGREDWWWCDALFMAPPVLTRLHAVTGERKYLDFLDAMWWDTTDFLFDKEEGLYYRDKNYIGRPNANGKKVFWARGNGWVMGGTVRVLQHLPKSHPTRARYVKLLQTMAASVARVQGADGRWRPSLLDPSEAPMPETSSTGFFCYALAWGVNNGHLERKTYLPVLKRAWQGLVDSVREDGKLGWV
ncbi:MAG TPA: glycoside hydrolase family 88 protein, partial [Pyrinomonadaceae bacterium]